MTWHFKWDDEKAAENLKRHGVSFGEARRIFDDPLASTVFDVLHSTAEEERFITIGQTPEGRTLRVVHSDSGNLIRIISAREATRPEREAYEEGT